MRWSLLVWLRLRLLAVRPRPVPATTAVPAATATRRHVVRLLRRSLVAHIPRRLCAVALLLAEPEWHPVCRVVVLAWTRWVRNR